MTSAIAPIVRSLLGRRIEELVARGLGWEDVYVILRKQKLVRGEDEDAIRRYVLSLGGHKDGKLTA